MYPTQFSGNPGGLLRMLLEEQSQNPTMVPPGTEVSSPIRGMIAEPLKAPESAGTSRMVSIRPEGVTAQQGPAFEQSVVAPVAPVAPMASPVSPVQLGGMPSSGPNISSQEGGMSPSVRSNIMGTSAAKAPAIGTSIKPTGMISSPTSSSPSNFSRGQSMSAAPRSRVGDYSIGGTMTAAGKKILPLATRIMPALGEVAGAALRTAVGKVPLFLPNVSEVMRRLSTPFGSRAKQA